MTYEEAVSYIKETAAFGSKLGLDNIRCLKMQSKVLMLWLAKHKGKKYRKLI